MSTNKTSIFARVVDQQRLRGNPAEPPADPTFNWERLFLPPETNFQVPGDGLVQRMATSLFARVPTLLGRDQHATPTTTTPSRR